MDIHSATEMQRLREDRTIQAVRLACANHLSLGSNLVNPGNRLCTWFVGPDLMVNQELTDTNPSTLLTPHPV